MFVVWKLLGLPHSKQTSMEYLPFTHCFLQGFGGCIKEVFGEEELHEPPEAWTQPPGGMCQTLGWDVSDFWGDVSEIGF